MQTFLPFADFARSAASLDMARLGKQRVENLQIMHALVDDRYGWQNHPAVRMWRGHEGALLLYQEAVVEDWEIRPRKSGKPAAEDTCLLKTVSLYNEVVPFLAEDNWDLPDWLGDDDFHESHRSNLIRKDPVYYGPKFASITREGLDYVWPV